MATTIVQPAGTNDVLASTKGSTIDRRHESLEQKPWSLTYEKYISCADLKGTSHGMGGHFNVVHGQNVKHALVLLITPVSTGLLRSTFSNRLAQATAAADILRSRHGTLHGELGVAVGLEELGLSVEH